MLKRPSSRLLVLDADKRLLLFRFEHNNGPLAGQKFWATPGGGVEAGESFEEAARRELFEEVGCRLEDLGDEVARRSVIFPLPSGEIVEGDERYFVARVGEHSVVDENRTAFEREVMTAHRWWTHRELVMTKDQVWPEDLAGMLIRTGIWFALS